MFVGHLAVGLGGKRLEPKISLGTWMLAAVLADLIVFPLLIVGVERFNVLPGVTVNRMVGEIPYSHSLLMDAIWGALFTAAYFARRRYPRGAWLLFATVLSHWVLALELHPRNSNRRGRSLGAGDRRVRTRHAPEKPRGNLCVLDRNRTVYAPLARKHHKRR